MPSMFHCTCVSLIRQLFISTKPPLATSKSPGVLWPKFRHDFGASCVSLPAGMPTCLCSSILPATVSMSCLLQLSGCLCRINDREAKYYADDEDAYDMRKQLTPWSSSKDDFKAIARRLDTVVKKT